MTTPRRARRSPPTAWREAIDGARLTVGRPMRQVAVETNRRIDAALAERRRPLRDITNI